MPSLTDRSGRDVPASAGRLSCAAALTLRALLDPAWRQVGDQLRRRFAFTDFAAAAAFVGRLAPLADADDHHPELVVGYGSVEVRLSTHDVDGLSERDFIVAAKLDRAYADLAG
ncbi:MAG: 4a-hydroxytetrahydrobiopterin dehydratase [Kofleriaceae bacterium]